MALIIMSHLDKTQLPKRLDIIYLSLKSAADTAEVDVRG